MLPEIIQTSHRSPMRRGPNVESTVKACLAVALLFAVSTSGVAQTSAASARAQLPRTDAIAQAPATGASGGPYQPPACFDGTPHTKIIVPVASGVQLQVLDWGGADKPDTMVLLTGLGDNAHIFDEFAYQFTDFFHVIGITRRGFLPSSQPPPSQASSGYEVDSRAHDDIAVLDFLGIRKAVFVGHSVAGSELSRLGTTYKDRVEKLVYLDAFDLSQRFQLPDIPGAPYTDADGRSLQIFLAAPARLEDILRPAQAVCFGVQFDDNGMITGSTTPGWVSQAILLGVQEPASPPTDWARVQAPRLGIFQQPSVEGKITYYSYLNPEDKKKFDENWPAIVQWYARTTDEFAAEHAGTPKPTVYRLPNAPHYFYLNNNQALVVRVMRDFLLSQAAP